MPNGSNLISVSEGTIPCRGNGKTLGIAQDTTSTYCVLSGKTYASQDRQGLLCGGTYSSSNLPATSSEFKLNKEAMIGITTNSSKSGIVVDFSSNTLVCKYIIKY